VRPKRGVLKPRLRRIEPVLRRALRGPCRAPKGARVLVAASGGADSTALLLGLRRIAHEFGIEIVAAHLHHGLRGADADRDLDFVRATCGDIGVPLIAARWDTKRRMRARGLAGQAGLRTLRREFLVAAARRAGAALIATAHTADDQLETLLMRLARGTGLPGLGGMSARRGRWIKPLLEAPRADIEADLERAGQRWREDRSNADRIYFRNRVRLDVIPALLQAMGAGPEDTGARAILALRAARVSHEARAARRALDERSRLAGSGVSRIVSGAIALDSRRLASFPPAVRSAFWRLLWRRIGPAGVGLTHRHLDSLDALVKPGRKSRIVLPGGIVATRERNQLHLRGSGHAVR